MYTYLYDTNFVFYYLLFEKWNNVGREKFFGGNLGRSTKKIEKHWYRV